MTPNEVYWWTLCLLLAAIIVVPSSVALMWRIRKHDRNGNMSVLFPLGLMGIFVGMLVPAMGVSLIDRDYPGESAVAYLLYSPQERQTYQLEGVLRNRLRPMMRHFAVVCPDPSIFEPQNAHLLSDWNTYYQSFLEPSALGQGCYYRNHPFTTDIEKPIGRS